jgi:hypothetical protein
MESNLDKMPLSLVMDMLEATAQKHDLLLSTNLIDFADDIWAQAQAQANATKGWTAEKFKPVQDDDSQVWMKWVDSNSYSMKTLKGKK